jgi:hypothetical protein
VPLTDEQSAAFTRGIAAVNSRERHDLRLMRYYQGRQRLAYLGIAIPPEMRYLETIVNWCRTSVDSLAQRLNVKALILPGEETASPILQEGWDVNNLDSRMPLAITDSLTLSRGVAAVGTNEDDPDHPLITIESPREIAIEIDPRTRKRLYGTRVYGRTQGKPGPLFGTLYTPDQTSWLAKDDGGEWEEVDRDEHRLGLVPLVPLVNRESTWNPLGESEMTDVIPLVDAAARALTNLQVAAETHSVPQKWVLGASKGDFVDSDGNPIPVWQAYFSGIWANGNADVKVGQFSASDLSNFHATVNHYAQLVSGVTGLPMRYYGQLSANPPSADGIRADESRLTTNAEYKQRTLGDGISELGALYMKFLGNDVDGRLIKTVWFDAGTPTLSAVADAAQKLTGGKPLLSIEGAWDMLGWSEPRKEQERSYMQSEQSDPTLEKIAASLLPAVRLTETSKDAAPAPALAGVADGLPTGK